MIRFCVFSLKEGEYKNDCRVYHEDKGHHLSDFIGRRRRNQPKGKTDDTPDKPRDTVGFDGSSKDTDHIRQYRDSKDKLG